MPLPFSRSHKSAILMALSFLFTSPCPGTKPLGPDASICKQAESPEALTAARPFPSNYTFLRVLSSEDISPATILHRGNIGAKLFRTAVI
jgi:hypothetical protein